MDDLGAFGNQDALLRLQAAAELGVGQMGVTGEGGVVQVRDFNNLGHGAISQPTCYQVFQIGRPFSGVFFGGQAIFLRREANAFHDVIGVVNITSQNGAVHAECLHTASVQSSFNLRIGSIFLKVFVLVQSNVGLGSSGNQSCFGGCAGGYANFDFCQILKGFNATVILNQQRYCVGVVRCGEIPGSFAFLIDGESGGHDVNITRIQQLATGGGGYWGEFHFINAQFLGNFVSQINLNAGIGVGGSVQQAKAGNVGFNAHAQNAALSDCVRGKAAGCGATLIAGGLIAAASCQSY